MKNEEEERCTSVNCTKIENKGKKGKEKYKQMKE